MLRDYQSRAVESCIDWLEDYRGMGVAVLPTAAGKSWIIAAIANHYGKALVLQPSKELLEQNYEKYAMYGNPASIYSASAGIKEVGDVTFATLGSIKSVPHLFAGRPIIVDECHLYPTNDSVFNSFLEALPKAKVIGLTATPFRLERMIAGSKLVMLASRRYAWKGYPCIVQIETVKDWWSPITYDYQVQESSTLKMNSAGSEYTDKSLEMFAKTATRRIEEALDKYKNKQALVFVPSVAQSELYAKKFGGKVVSAYTPKKERNDIIRGFKSGEENLIFNVDVLGVGFDHPALSVLIDANPTMSLSRYYQRIGRLTRPHENKKFYVDIAGNSVKFGRVETLEFRNNQCWNGDIQLTNVYLHDIGVNVPDTMPFGKFKGKPIKSLPIWYLEWCIDQDFNKALLNELKKEFVSRW
jgi:DNA repair protein RadD